jgi:protein tyrosine/serine phosphatase
MLSLLVSNERDTKAELAAEREWAEYLEVPGVRNSHKVSEELYRGAQPSGEGMRQLKKFGIKTIVNLRSFHSDRKEIGDTGLSYEHIYMKTWHPEEKEVVRFLQIATDKDRTPAFVHCQRGADRTGTMCAIYRIAVQGWSKDEAIEEITKGGFGFYSGWKNLINYICEVDIEEIKSRAGLEN